MGPWSSILGVGTAAAVLIDATLVRGILVPSGLTGTLKNSAQALLKRLRQDAYTDLVAMAVQTAPPPPNKSDVWNAIRRRTLTPVTPN